MVFVIMAFASVIGALVWQWQENRTVAIGNNRGAKLKSNFFAFLTVLPVYLVYSLQYSLHSDYDNYLKWFYQIKAGTYEIRDFSVNLIFKIVGQLNLDFQFALIIIYLISFCILVCCIKKYSNLYASSIILFISLFFVLGFLQIRQLVAVMIVLYAYRFIAERKPILYFILILVAISFHNSAAVMIPFYFIFKIKFKTSHFLVFFAGMSFISIFTDKLLPLITKIFFPQYLGRHEMFRGLELSKIDIAMQLVIFLVVLLYGINAERLKPIDRLFLYAFLFQFIMFFTCRWIVEVNRFLYYLYIPSIMLIPNLISYEKNPKQRVAFQIVFTGIIFILLFVKYRYSEILLNYKTIFS